jgi:hypothetical protein
MLDIESVELSSVRGKRKTVQVSTPKRMGLSNAMVHLEFHREPASTRRRRPTLVLI